MTIPLWCARVSPAGQPDFSYLWQCLPVNLTVISEPPFDHSQENNAESAGSSETVLGYTDFYFSIASSNPTAMSQASIMFRLINTTDLPMDLN